jgi:hypothetical protein
MNQSMNQSMNHYGSQPGDEYSSSMSLELTNQKANVKINSRSFIPFKDHISSTSWIFSSWFKSFQTDFENAMVRDELSSEAFDSNLNNKMIIFNQELCGLSPFVDSLCFQ